MAVIQGPGQVVYLKGQVALDEGGSIVGEGDMQAQTRKALENIQATLAALGGRMEDIVSLTNYVTDIDRFMACGDIRRQFFTEPYPVTTTVQVVRLYDARLLVEIAAVAEIPHDRFEPPGERDATLPPL